MTAALPDKTSQQRLDDLGFTPGGDMAASSAPYKRSRDVAHLVDKKLHDRAERAVLQGNDCDCNPRVG
jgi:hypothetical protein